MQPIRRGVRKEPREAVARARAARPDTPVEVWAEDEHRLGPKPVRRRVWAPIGARPTAPDHHRYRWLHVTAFVQPTSGEALRFREEATPPGGQDTAVTCAEVLAQLDTLPEEQRAVPLLVGVEGLGHDEAARVLGVPIGTVMSRLSRGRERLRRMDEGRPAPVTVLRRVV